MVKPETGEGPHCTWHRDLFLPCGFLPVEEINVHSPHPDSQRRIRLRAKRTKDIQEDEEELEDELYSDEDKLYLNMQVPEIITRGPFIERKGGFVNVLPPLQVLAPENSTHEPHSEIPVIPESHVAVTHSTSPCGAPDHVVITIPEPVMTHTPTENDMNNARTESVVENSASAVLEAEPVGLRRSVREKRHPHKFTYDELGEPLILAISSFLQALGTAVLLIPVPVKSDMHAETHAV